MAVQKVMMTRGLVPGSDRLLFSHQGSEIKGLGRRREDKDRQTRLSTWPNSRLLGQVANKLMRLADPYSER